MTRQTITAVALCLAILMPVPAIGYYWLLGLVATLEDNEKEQLQDAATIVSGLLAENDTVLAQLTEDMTGAIAVVPINTYIIADGQIDDWPVHTPLNFSDDDIVESHQPYNAASLTCRLSVGADSSYVYLFYEVIDDNVVYREFNNPSVHRNDHIRISLITNDSLQRYTIANLQPATISAHVISENGRALRRTTDISGEWRATAKGYNVELQLPRSMAGSGFATAVVDVDDTVNRDVQFAMGTGPTSAPSLLGQLHFPTPDLSVLLGLMPFAVTVGDRAGNLIGQGGAANGSKTQDEAQVLTWFEPRSIGATEDILRLGEPIGTVTVHGVTRSAARLGNQTLAQLAIGSVILVGIGFCLVLIWRVDLNRRLQDLYARIAATAGIQGDSSAARTGWLAPNGVEQHAKAMADLVTRIQQHNDYLARMASSLNHELRTPVSVVRSSLDHLNASDIAVKEQVYVQRAQEGIARLTTILNKMSEARRLEESLDEDEIVRFDLAQVIAGCVDGYRIAYPDHQFSLSIEDDQVAVTGIPDLMAQLLDKLVDNATEFATGEQPIKIILATENGSAMLHVINAGPALPGDMTDTLFESMVSVREHPAGNRSGATHLGLGLYVAKLIADFHGGTIWLSNQETQGVVATVVIPLLRLTAKLR